MKRGNQPVLQLGLQVNHQIAATQQVQLGKRWVLDDVLHCKDHHFTHLLLHPVAAVIPDKETVQPLRRHVLRNVGGVATGARRVDGVVVEVGGIDLHLEVLLGPIHVFEQQNRQ